jgi:hypothetical protein
MMINMGGYYMKKRLKKKGRFSAVKKVVKVWYYHEIEYFCAVNNIKTNHINIKRATTHYMTKYLDNSDKLLVAFFIASCTQTNPPVPAPYLKQIFRYPPHLLAAKKNRSEVK